MAFQQSEAQAWQWGKRGGSSEFDINNNNETVVDMATDKNGNVYVLSSVRQIDLNVDGHPLTGWGEWDNVVSSFSCDGTYRWSKIIGTSTIDAARAIKTDTLGGVYITGALYMVNNYTGHFDNDTTLAISPKSLYLVKYDTGGNFKWLRMPQADTVTTQAAAHTVSVDMDVDGNGNTFVLCQLQQGAYASGAYVAPNLGTYILQYNAQGNFVSGMQLDMSIYYLGYLHMARDHKNGRFYFCGYNAGGTNNMGGNPITHSMYAGAFNSQGQFLWKRENTDYNLGFISRPVIDDSGYVYLNGIASTNDNFNGYVVTNTFANSVYSLPLVIKIDSTGTNKWGANGSSTVGDYTFGVGSIVLRNNNEVAITGDYGHLKWPGINSILSKTPNAGASVFLIRINSHTGLGIASDTLIGSFGYNEVGAVLTSDKKGNLFVGGFFDADLRVPNDTLENIGGQTDFFVAKYGCNCGATLANYTANVNNAGHSAAFTYTGTAPYDSLKWSFGDNTTANTGNDTISHSYALPGTYQVCVTVYTACDSNTYCSTVQVAVGVATIPGMADVIIYPNPASDELYMDNVPKGTNVRLFNMMGQQLYQGTAIKAREAININVLPAGTYFLEFTDPEGRQSTARFAKE
ncbi:MAG: hypothetical protein BGO69_10965 [Bacteroidetes bacterium 46-16]|nr:MAG: hypothetical protein BGO69_10965 [Bacteroidetes bacterium 46-16]